MAKRDFADVRDVVRAKINVVTDPKKYRPLDAPLNIADISKLQAITGWSPEIPIEDSVAETLSYWRKRV